MFVVIFRVFLVLDVIFLVVLELGCVVDVIYCGLLLNLYCIRLRLGKI